MAMTLGFLLKASSEQAEAALNAVKEKVAATAGAAGESFSSASEVIETKFTGAMETISASLTRIQEKAAVTAAEMQAEFVKSSGSLEQRFEAATEGVTSKFIQMGAGLALPLAAITAVGGALFEMANKATEAGEQLYLASKATGVSGEMLNGLKRLAIESGVEFEQLERGIGHLGLSMSSLEEPSSEAGKAIKELGISTRDSHGQLKTMDEILPEVMDKIAAMPDGSEKAAIMLELFSRSGLMMTAAMDIGSAGLYRAMAAQKAYSGMTNESIQRDAEFQEQLKDLKEDVADFVHLLGEGLVSAWEWVNKEVSIATALEGEYVDYLELAIDEISLWSDKLTHNTQLIKLHEAAIQKDKESIGTWNSIIAHAGEHVDKASTALKQNAATLAGATGSEGKHTKAVKDDADAMLQASMAAQGYTAQLEMMRKVVEASNAAQEKAAELAHEQIQNYKSGAGAQPGGSINMPESAIPSMATQLPAVTLQVTKTQQAFQGLAQAIQNMSDKFGKAGPMMNTFAQQIQAIQQRMAEGKKGTQAWMDVQAKQGQTSLEAGTQMAAGYGMEAASFIKNKKAQAIVMAVMETAKGLSEVLWNPAAAALDFASAAMYGVIAGTSGGSSGGGGGGGQGGGASQPGASGQGVAPGGSMVGSGGGGGGDYHQTMVNIYGGGLTDTNNLQNLVTSMNSGGANGTVRLNVAGTSATIPTPAY